MFTDKNKLYEWRYVEHLEQYLHILDIEHVIVCFKCGNLCSRNWSVYECDVHGADFTCDDLLIYYTLSDKKQVIIKERGWIRRTGEEVRVGRYGLFVKEYEFEKEKLEHLMNLKSAGEVSELLESVSVDTDAGIYAVLLSDLLRATAKKKKKNTSTNTNSNISSNISACANEVSADATSS